jgi:hypothetical protein
MAKPQHKPTEDQRKKAENWAMVGVPHDHIVILLGLGSLHTLYRHYRAELDLGKAKANAAIGGTLFKQAMAGNVSAAIYWTKSQMGWREVQRVEHTGADGGPIRTNVLPLDISEESAAKAYLEIMGEDVSGTLERVATRK